MDFFKMEKKSIFSHRFFQNGLEKNPSFLPWIFLKTIFFSNGFFQNGFFKMDFFKMDLKKKRFFSQMNQIFEKLTRNCEGTNKIPNTKKTQFSTFKLRPVKTFFKC